MSDLPTGSAPEQVDHLQRLWERLPIERQRVLGFAWVDHAVRAMLPEAFDQAGFSGIGVALRTVPAITDPTSLRVACERVAGLETPDGPIEPLSAYFSVVVSLKDLVMNFQVYECCFLA